ncbi:MAG: peptide chain release factor N(5)-glutamine methyltransferase [Proteobacteria bacterium]|nr:peptide chain release factor N(5)-glutamine methyltransferase [Pseudomonadota bacterium]
MTTFGHLLASATSKLASVSDTPRLDAEILLSLATGKTRTYFRAWPEKPLAQEEETAFQRLLENRLTGHPIAHLTGTREFWSREFRVTPDVLIPRPETELLIELALKLIPAGQAVHIADLGTGSGAIAVTLALELPKASITALDLSPAALKLAAENAARLGAGNVCFIQSDWFAAMPFHVLGCRRIATFPPRISPKAPSGLLLPPIGPFDLIVSNPPYIAENDPHLVEGDVRFEPRLALISGPDGLDAIRRIVGEAPKRLNPGGWLLFEHGYGQAGRAGELLRAAGFVDVESFADLQGHLRVSGGRSMAPINSHSNRACG